MNEAEDRRTAIHEAGHVWAYHRARRAIRYVTLRPRRAGISGLVLPSRRLVSIELRAWIAAAGPVAEATHIDLHGSGGDGWCSESWEDELTGLLLFGEGSADYGLIPAHLDKAWFYEQVLQEQEADWDRISRLADELQARRTLLGREAFALLDRG